MTDNDAALLSKGIQSMLNGNCVLLTGAGASAPARNEAGDHLPVGGALAAFLYKKCDLPADDDLADAAETFKEKYGASDLIAVLKRVLNVTEIADCQKTLYAQDWRNIYTTNYDRTPVIAAESSNRTLIPLTLDADPANYADKQKCIHINGRLDRLDVQALDSQFKLTTKSYETSDHFQSSIWSRQFEDDINAAEFVFIVGMSLEHDLDLKRVYNINEQKKKKTIIITRNLASSVSDEERLKHETAIRKLSRYGTVFPIGLEAFAQYIEAESARHIPYKPSTWLYTCFEQYIPASNISSKPLSNEIYQLFINGEMDRILLHHDGHNYTDIVKRRDLDDIIELIKEGRRLIYIHSDFGNGKSIILQEIADMAYRIKREVFILDNINSERIQKDIDKISEIRRPKVVIIDTFNNYKDVLRRFALKNNETTTFVLAARSGLMTSIRPEFDAMFKCENSSYIFDVNKLTHGELIKLCDILQKNGLWNELAGKTRREQLKFLTDKKHGCSKFQTILLDLLKSKSIREKLNKIVNEVKAASPNNFRALVAILLAKMLTLDLSAGDINEIARENIMNNTSFACNEGINQLLHQRGRDGLFAAKSSIIAKFVLHASAKINDVIDVLTDIAEHCIKYSSSSRYFNILRNLISFSLLSTFIEGFSRRNEFMVAYYERLAQNLYYSKNHFFWLQFAIALIKIGDETGNKNHYDRAAQYLYTAHGLKPSADFVPFQINNQMARLLLKKIERGFSENIADDFLNAHNLLKLPISSTRDNPILVVNLYRYYLRPEIENKITHLDDGKTYFHCGKEAYNNISNLCKRLSGADRLEGENLKEAFLNKFGAVT